MKASIILRQPTSKNVTIWTGALGQVPRVGEQLVTDSEGDPMIVHSVRWDLEESTVTILVDG